MKFRSGNGFRFATKAAVEEYEICGHLSTRLSMSLSGHKGDAEADLDVYVALRKLDSNGEEQWFASSVGTPTPVCFGWIRASHRTLDPQPYRELAEGALPFPVLSHKRADKKPVKNEEVYVLDFELWPTNIIVEKGEILIFEVIGKDPEGVSWFGSDEAAER